MSKKPSKQLVTPKTAATTLQNKHPALKLLPEATVEQNVERDGETCSGDTLTCRSCQCEFQRSQWCFYTLCDPCFAEFNSQKMAARHARMRGAMAVGTEDVNTWLQQRGVTNPQ